MGAHFVSTWHSDLVATWRNVGLSGGSSNCRPGMAFVTLGRHSFSLADVDDICHVVSEGFRLLLEGEYKTAF